MTLNKDLRSRALRRYFAQKYKGQSADQLKTKLKTLRKTLLATTHIKREPIRQKIRNIERHLELNLQKCRYCHRSFDDHQLTEYASFACCFMCLKQQIAMRKEHFRST